jgi:Putative cyclase
MLDWHERGGLVARGVLIDYKAYAEAKGIKYSCFDAHKITIADMEAVAKHQGTEFKFGDVLIVRSGFTEDLGGMNAQEQEQAMSTHKCVGVEGSEEVAKWVWNHHFASVAGDAIAFEVIPPTLASGEIGQISDLGKSNTASSYVQGGGFAPIGRLD